MALRARDHDAHGKRYNVARDVALSIKFYGIRVLWYDWRRALIYTHRWLGIAGCIVIVVWFVSGVVMM
jgi:hypothetical protein